MVVTQLQLHYRAEDNNFTSFAIALPHAWNDSRVATLIDKFLQVSGLTLTNHILVYMATGEPVDSLSPLAHLRTGHYLLVPSSLHFAPAAPPAMPDGPLAQCPSCHTWILKWEACWACHQRQQRIESGADWRCIQCQANCLAFETTCWRCRAPPPFVPPPVPLVYAPPS